jgi:hypothetical protein
VPASTLRHATGAGVDANQACLYTVQIAKTKSCSDRVHATKQSLPRMDLPQCIGMHLQRSFVRRIAALLAVSSFQLRHRLFNRISCQVHRAKYHAYIMRDLCSMQPANEATRNGTPRPATRPYASSSRAPALRPQGRERESKGSGEIRVKQRHTGLRTMIRTKVPF